MAMDECIPELYTSDRAILSFYAIISRRWSYLDQACRDAGAGRDDGLETSFVHYEVANCEQTMKHWTLAPRDIKVAIRIGWDGIWGKKTIFISLGA